MHCGGATPTPYPTSSPTIPPHRHLARIWVMKKTSLDNPTPSRTCGSPVGTSHLRRAMELIATILSFVSSTPRTRSSQAWGELRSWWWEPREVILLTKEADKIAAWSCTTLARLRGEGHGKHTRGAWRHDGGCGVAAAMELWVRDLRSRVGELVLYDGSPVHGAPLFSSNWRVVHHSYTGAPQNMPILCKLIHY